VSEHAFEFGTHREEKKLGGFKGTDHQRSFFCCHLLVAAAYALFVGAFDHVPFLKNLTMEVMERSFAGQNLHGYDLKKDRSSYGRACAFRASRKRSLLTLSTSPLRPDMRFSRRRMCLPTFSANLRSVRFVSWITPSTKATMSLPKTSLSPSSFKVARAWRIRCFSSVACRITNALRLFFLSLPHLRLENFFAGHAKMNKFVKSIFFSGYDNFTAYHVDPWGMQGANRFVSSVAHVDSHYTCANVYTWLRRWCRLDVFGQRFQVLGAVASTGAGPPL
jgi:hypothetical protein